MDRIDALLRSAVDAGRVHGVAAAAASRSGETVAGAAGWRDAARSDPVTSETIFRIASMTKAVTSVAAMQLVERGVFELETPVGKLLPPLARPSVLEGFDARGEPRLRPAARPITVRHLLTHTSGLGYEIWSAPVQRYMQVAGVPSILVGGDGFLDVPLLFDPGERWEYGVSTDWLGRLIEAASGESLDGYFRSEILEPLDMNDTHFVLPPGADGRLASVWRRQTDGSLVEAELEPPRDVRFFSGGGGLLSTARDYLRFLRMLLGGGELEGRRILSAQGVARMARNQIGDHVAGSMKTAAPALSNEVALLPDLTPRFGLGFLVNGQAVPGGRAAGSLAWAGLYNSYYWIDPANGIAGVILTQVLPFFDTVALDLFAAFERFVYAEWTA